MSSRTGREEVRQTGQMPGLWQILFALAERARFFAILVIFAFFASLRFPQESHRFRKSVRTSAAVVNFQFPMPNLFPYETKLSSYVEYSYDLV
jgi:hypothetical protein